MFEPTKFIIPGEGERQGSKIAFPLRGKGDSRTVSLLRQAMTYAPVYLQQQIREHLAELTPGHYITDRTGRPLFNMVDDNPRVAKWKKQVAAPIAAEAHARRELFRGPVRNVLTFFTKRPKQHFTKKGLRPEAPIYDATEPDLFKVVRSIEDAMSGVVYVDDKQVCHVSASKQYADADPYIEVAVYPLYDAPSPDTRLFE